MRWLLQDTSTAGMSPDATAGFILAFAIVGFALAVLIAYTFFQTNKFNALQHRVADLEAHPKLVAKDVLEIE
ncbi:hypothetical protein Ndes2526B_g03753 [Nannochloris sp. 'desiccata']|nr:hypothetical protein KSW81_005385 [Chlorella desiccata (nom. nud.)]